MALFIAKFSAHIVNNPSVLQHLYASFCLGFPSLQLYHTIHTSSIPTDLNRFSHFVLNILKAFGKD